METERQRRRSLDRHIVWPLAVAQTVIWAATYYLFPALLLHWEGDFGWSKTELTLAYTLSLVTSAALAPLTGRWIDRGAARYVLAGSAVLATLALSLLALVEASWQFTACWLLLGIAMSGGLYEACFSVLTRYAREGAKRAITRVSLVAGFAGTLSFPLNHALAGMWGWRIAVLCFAALVLCLVTPLVWHAGTRGERLLGDARSERHGPAGKALGCAAQPGFLVPRHRLHNGQRRSQHGADAPAAASWTSDGYRAISPSSRHRCWVRCRFSAGW